MEEHQKRIAWVWIPVTIGVGLLIAMIYLGGRILSAHLEPRPTAAAGRSIPEPAASRPALLPTQPISPIGELSLQSSHVEEIITPQEGERYLQVGAVNIEAAPPYLEQLRRKKLEPQLAPGPDPRLLRVLIGPFDNADALMEQEEALNHQGIDNFVRKY